MTVDQFPRSRFELGVGVLATIVLLVILRELVGVPLGNSMDWETWVGIASGLLGAIAMVGALELIADVDDDDRTVFRQIVYVHLVFGTVAGAFFPAIMALLGVSNQWSVAYPGAIVTGLVYSVVLFVFAMVVYLLVGALKINGDGVSEVAAVFGLFFLYGVVFGVSMSLTRLVWFQLFSL